MNASSLSEQARLQDYFQLRFRPLFNAARGYVFPCDAQGQVNIDELSEKARNNYFYARAMVGRELETPAVCLQH